MEVFSGSTDGSGRPTSANPGYSRADWLRDEADLVVSEFFDRRADRYDAAYVAPGAGRHVLRARMAAALRLIGDGVGDALDVGMGAGRLCEELAGRGWTVSGLDISEGMVRRAQARLPAAADRLHCGAVERLPFPDASFDLVCATGVLEYVRDLSDALDELTRVLRPHGRAVFSIPSRNAPYRYSRLIWDPIARRARRLVDPHVYRTPGGIGGSRRMQFRRALELAGFEVTASRRTGAMVLPVPLDLVMPGIAERGARAAERASWSRRVFATQLIFAATKRGES